MVAAVPESIAIESLVGLLVIRYLVFCFLSFRNCRSCPEDFCWCSRRSSTTLEELSELDFCWWSSRDASTCVHSVIGVFCQGLGPLRCCILGFYPRLFCRDASKEEVG